MAVDINFFPDVKPAIFISWHLLETHTMMRPNSDIRLSTQSGVHMLNQPKQITLYRHKY